MVKIDLTLIWWKKSEKRKVGFREPLLLNLIAKLSCFHLGWCLSQLSIELWYLLFHRDIGAGDKSGCHQVLSVLSHMGTDACSPWTPKPSSAAHIREKFIRQMYRELFAVPTISTRNNLSASDVCWGSSKKTFLWYFPSWFSLARLTRRTAVFVDFDP